MKYHEQMKHPLWQKKRLEVLEANGFECENCGSKEDTLHVHHPYYKRGAMLWDYETEELQCLCEKCHKTEHALDERLKKIVATLSRSHKHQAIGYLEALSGETLLNPDSFEYIMGVGDWLSYMEKPSQERNLRYDLIESFFIDANKSVDALDLIEIYKAGVQ